MLVDDFLKFTWVFFLTNKNEVFSEFQLFYKKIEHNDKFKIFNIQSDHGGEFQNNEFDQFCRNQSIHQKFSSLRTPEQNRIKRNTSQIEAKNTDVALTDES